MGPSAVAAESPKIATASYAAADSEDDSWLRPLG
jgi:hypothetical protein